MPIHGGTELWIAVASLVISGIALYRADLRGPKLSLTFLQEPAQWHTQAYRYGPGGALMQLNTEKPPRDATLRLQISSTIPLVVQNDGPRSGVIHGLEFSLVHLPTLFELMASMPNSPPTITVDGKGKYRSDRLGYAPMRSGPDRYCAQRA